MSGGGPKNRFKTFGGGAANEAGNAGKAGDKPPATAGGITLKEAWQRYRDAHLVRKGRSKRTIESYRDHVERIFVQWLETPLQELAQERPAGPGRRVFRPSKLRPWPLRRRAIRAPHTSG
jgi:hypothetical protein